MNVVLLDRDGTVIRDPEDERVDKEEKIELFPDTIDALRLLAESGFSAIFITNQAGIAEGRITVADFERIHARVLTLLAPSGIRVLKTYRCPHAPKDGCACRKPKPKMIQDALAEFNLIASEVFMVGDRVSDVDAGIAALTNTILVETANIPQSAPQATFTSPTLLAAAKNIIAAR